MRPSGNRGTYIPEPLAQLSRFGRPRQAFRFRQGRDTGSGGWPGRLHEPKCGGMPQVMARRAPSAHGCPRRPLRGGVRGGRICRSRRCQMVSRISCCTVRASTRRNRWQATLACPRTRTCRAPQESLRAEFTRSTPGAAGSGRGRGVCGPLSSAPAPLSRGAPSAPRRGGGWCR